MPGPELTGSQEGDLLRMEVVPRRGPSSVTLSLDVPISEAAAGAVPVAVRDDRVQSRAR